MTREALIARLRYYACEDAAQGDVLNDVIALLQRDGEKIAALEADRDQLRAELSECKQTISEIIQDEIRINFLQRCAETCTHTNNGRLWQFPNASLEGHTFRDAVDNAMTACEG